MFDMNIKNQMETLMSSELKEVEAGTCNQGTCVCENGGAGEIIIVDPNLPSNPIYQQV